MATTTNFGWETPDDTDLVKDGAAAMRTLGNSIDTSFVDLKGGTTGQILAKASNTDLDYTWITNDVGDITAVNAGTGLTGGGTSGSVTLSLDSAAVIAPTIVDAKGDIIAATAADTVSRLAVGSNDQVLTADSSTATGLKWASPSSGSLTQLATGTLSGSTTAVSFSTTGYRNVYVLINGATANNPFEMGGYYNGNSGLSWRWATVYNANGSVATNGGTNSSIPFSGLRSGNNSGGANTYQMTFYDIQNSSTTQPKLAFGTYSMRNSADTGRDTAMVTAETTGIGVMSSLTFACAGGSFNGGTYYIYGVK